MPIRSLDPKAARDAMAGTDGHVFVDVRTVQEYDAGHPAGAVNVPWAIIDPASGQMAHNAGFLPTMRKHYASDTTLFISCQAGGRSLKACHELEAAGYGDLVNVDGGFGGRRDPMGSVLVEGWQASGLPIESDASTYESLKN